MLLTAHNIDPHGVDLWRKASADKGLRKSTSYCVEQP